MEIKDLLPIGSVVRLKDGKKRIMIFGVKQTGTDNGTQADYIGVLYPEGNMGPEFQYLFDHEKIEEVIFHGFEDDERGQFIAALEKIYKDK